MASRRPLSRRAATIPIGAVIGALLGVPAPALATPAGVVAAPSAPAPTDRSAEHWCEARLDEAVATARRGDLTSANDALLALGDECTGLPQIQHDLGVIALRRGDDAAAIHHLERALAADERTARTVGALREIRRWRAAAAWADALGESPDRHAPPVLELLDSSVPDAARTREAARDALLRDEAVLEYELYEWWQTQRRGDADDVATYYASDAVRDADAALRPPSAAATAARAPDVGLPDWEAVERDLEFADRDGVAVLRWREGAVSVGRLLLLRAVDDRWLIYRETVL